MIVNRSINSCDHIIETGSIFEDANQNLVLPLFLTKKLQVSSI